ncbi:YdcF family protein [Chengkuizengella axinellae]|uniref:YdcF family protein n=1 Tax=Chengkuizengella axinellae TaxID=3064388 RepID=A0ABT9IXC5_9BACL|nr:YdcF family protein [Chengkuizengella sp. 2205SS18-9]MDP5273980.1 YdcF family protein [Chengkuizengella sp. 2205SS18-9]
MRSTSIQLVEKRTSKIKSLFIKWFKIGLVLLLLFLIWTGYVQWKIHSVEKMELPTSSDVGIVMGMSLWENEASPGLKERLNHAIALYEQGHFNHIIVSGGLDANGATITEAEGMKIYLMANGIPEENIFEEREATSSYENILYSKRIMEENDLETTIIITHAYHGARTLEVAKFFDLTNPIVSTTKSEVLFMPYHKGRETLAYTKWKMDELLLNVGVK